MAQARYHQVYEQMLNQHKQEFDAFSQIHAAYTANPQQHQQVFNTQGKQLLSIIRDYERRLVSQTERGGFSRYSTNLSEKFWSLVRQTFPLIDKVGLK